MIEPVEVLEAFDIGMTICNREYTAAQRRIAELEAENAELKRRLAQEDAAIAGHVCRAFENVKRRRPTVIVSKVEEEVSHPARCPVCNGSGKLSVGIGMPESRVGYTATRQETAACHACGGLGWVTVQDAPASPYPETTPFTAQEPGRTAR